MVRVVSPGALALVQDAGRWGHQRYGVSVSGAIDHEALFLGNRLVGNTADAAAIEITLGGADFEFTDATLVAVTGGDLDATLDGVPVPMWESVGVTAGSRLTFGGPMQGLRAYLCIAGGIDTTPVLGSRSTHSGSRLGGLDGGPLRAGNDVPVGYPPAGAEPGLRVPGDLVPEYPGEIVVRVVPGPQEDAFTSTGVDTFYDSAYMVTDRSDRQGVRLDGPVIEAKDGRYDIVSDAVPLGSVQVPGDGKPIILLADRQTTGGYAKIGVVAGVDLPKLAQVAPGASIKFQPVTVQEAQAAARARRQALRETELEHPAPSSVFEVSVGGESHRVRFLRPRSNQARFGVQVDVDGERLLIEVETTADE